MARLTAGLNGMSGMVTEGSEIAAVDAFAAR